MRDFAHADPWHALTSAYRLGDAMTFRHFASSGKHASDFSGWWSEPRAKRRLLPTEHICLFRLRVLLPHAVVCLKLSARLIGREELALTTGRGQQRDDHNK